MSALCSPVSNNAVHPPSGHLRRMSPYVADGQTCPGNINSNRSNDYVNISSIGKSLESTYTEDVVDPQSSRPISGNSSEAPLSHSSLLEQGTRRSHGGIKLPGMSGDRVEDVKLKR